MWVYKKVRTRLFHLAGKHLVLRRVREVCQASQRKWLLAGPLAQLDSTELASVLAALVGRHLVVLESNGAFSIHPAVRDYFHQLATANEQAGWHDLLRQQLVSLIKQPGSRLPQDAPTLDLVEEAIHHATEGGRPTEAEHLYREVLGGFRHLAWKLGETNRGLRIFRGFPSCPDPDGLAWCMRALGEFDEAHCQHWMPYFRADVRLLQGRLPLVAAEGDDVRSAAAAFLMGHTRTLPPDSLGCAFPRDYLQLYSGRPIGTRYIAKQIGLYQEMGWEAERARYQLIEAEAARRNADTEACFKGLVAATSWILHSGSVEHLCLWHLIRARAGRATGDFAFARSAVEEGCHLARRCGLRLYLVELMCEEAELLLCAEKSGWAELVAREAFELAQSSDFQFLWGAAEAGHLLGQALATKGHLVAARDVLAATLDLRERLGHPQIRKTEQLLYRVSL